MPIASHRIIDMLSAYHWPGNVRELITVLEQAVLKASNEGSILEKHLPAEIVSGGEGSGPTSGGDGRAGMAPYEATKDEERQRIISAIRAAKGNRRKAADLLEIPRSTLYVKIRRYNIGLKHTDRGKRWTAT